jgi:hypothetical protein
MEPFCQRKSLSEKWANRQDFRHKEQRNTNDAPPRSNPSPVCLAMTAKTNKYIPETAHSDAANENYKFAISFQQSAAFQLST